MDKIWVRKGQSFEEEAEANQEFWERMTGQERVQVVLDMLDEAWRAASISRLERVAHVVEWPEPDMSQPQDLVDVQTLEAYGRIRRRPDPGDPS